MAMAESDQRSTAWFEGAAILIAVLVCANVAAFNNYQKEKQFQRLEEVAQGRKDYLVRRGGQKVVVKKDEIVVGEVVVLAEGEEVPGDGLVLSCHELKLDESSMTGESDPVRKCQQGHEDGLHQCLLISGTRILEGEGEMLVLAVGVLSRTGELMGLAGEESEPSPLE